MSVTERVSHVVAAPYPADLQSFRCRVGWLAIRGVNLGPEADTY
jgi:hypothetical protein